MTDEQLNKIIFELHMYANSVDEYEFGLPYILEEDMETMRKIIRNNIYL